MKLANLLGVTAGGESLDLNRDGSLQASELGGKASTALTQLPNSGWRADSNDISVADFQRVLERAKIAHPSEARRLEAVDEKLEDSPLLVAQKRSFGFKAGAMLAFLFSIFTGTFGIVALMGIALAAIGFIWRPGDEAKGAHAELVSERRQAVDALLAAAARAQQRRISAKDTARVALPAAGPALSSRSDTRHGASSAVGLASQR